MQKKMRNIAVIGNPITYTQFISEKLSQFSTIFTLVKNLWNILSIQVKIPRGMLEYVVGMAGKVIESIAEDTKTRLMIKKPDMKAK